jgi:hypothetical protein
MFALHHLRPARLSRGRDYCLKLPQRSLVSRLRVPTILNLGVGSDGLRDSPAYMPG